MTTLRFPFLAATLLLFTSTFTPAAHAQTADGRPTAQVPVGPNIAQVATPGGSAFETMRIKRTVAMDPAGGVDGKWDVLYAVQDASGGTRTTYLDWDDDYLYVAVETASPVETRIDIDGHNDGWLHGADNLRLDVTPVGEGSSDAPRVTALRFDMEQNREMPVWAASPIPVGSIKAAGGKTPRGTYVVMLAIPNTDAIGLALKSGANFGIRADTGVPAAALTPTEGEVVSIPVRSMLRVGLADAVSASRDGLDVQLTVDGPHNITPGGNIKLALEIKNDTNSEKTLQRLYIRGTMGSADFVDEQKFAGVTIAPGKSVKRELQSTVSPSAPLGAIAIAGGVDTTDGVSVASLVSFDKVAPYSIRVETDDKPIPAGGDKGKDPTRTLNVFVRSHVNARTTATIQLHLPEGWTVASGSLAQQDRALIKDGDVGLAKFQFVVPASAKLGYHTIGATVTVAGRTYSAETRVVIAQ